MSPQPIPIPATESSQLIRQLIQELVSNQATADVTMAHSTMEKYVHLKRIIIEQLDKNHAALSGMCNTLNLDRDRNETPEVDRAALTKRTLRRLTGTMLEDGCTNWGRLVIWIAFCCQMAKNSGAEQREDNEEVVHEITEFLVEYLDNDFREKINDLGGWSALRTVFPEQDQMESLVWKGLLGTFVGLGICSLALIAAK
jgi:hypothetical protein